MAAASRQILPCMFTVLGTKEFLDRAPNPGGSRGRLAAVHTILGAWYVTVLFWKPHVAVFVNEPTRLPFVPLAPAATVLTRMPQTAATVFTSLGLGYQWISREGAEMGTHQLTTAANRSVLVTMNDFAYLAGAHRGANQSVDLIALSL